jgi:hypothetical protein
MISLIFHLQNKNQQKKKIPRFLGQGKALTMTSTIVRQDVKEQFLLMPILEVPIHQIGKL